VRSWTPGYRLRDISDVNTQGVTAGQGLIYDGTKWVVSKVIIPTPGTPPPGGWPSNVFYQDPAGELSNEDAFNYNASTNTLAVENITGTTVTGSGVVKGSNTFGQRYATQAATNRAAADTASLTVERYFTVTAEGNGESFNIQSNTPSAGNKIVRKIWYKDEAFEDTDVDTWTLLHTFANDATYASTATKWQEYLDGQANGTPPFTLAISWEEAAAIAYLLDAYSGSALAYSLRLLDSTYTGDAIRVRRASDNAEQDIGFDVNGDLDTSVLTTFCTGTDGFLKTWYDQSGNAKDLSQTTSANQPKIYDSSTGVLLDDTHPAIYFDNTDTFVINNTGLDIGSLSSFVIANLDTTGNGQMILALSASVGNKRWYAPFVNGGNFNFGYASSTTAITTSANADRNLHTMIAGSTLGVVQAWVNSVSAGTASLDSGIDTITTGLMALANSFQAVGFVQEVIVYPSDQSANRANIETNINDYYSIY
jgi:hypothetical protein